jgi:hypothetical protein
MQTSWIRKPLLDRIAPERESHVEGIMRDDALTIRRPATTFMCVPNATNRDTQLPTALLTAIDSDTGMPRYKRGYIWSGDRHVPDSFSNSSLFASPLPSVPINELQNRVALDTISSNPELFKIVTPINVDVFQNYLKSHPNRPFVDSVCRGLREGFWPWADTSNPKLPQTWDCSQRELKNNQISFVQKQIEVEHAAQRYSSSFGSQLLPGMYSMPIGVVPKPHSDDSRLVTDHSASDHSLNSLIPHHEGSVQLDNLQDFGQVLRNIHDKSSSDLVLFKSDVSSAYRLMPMHPLWQIRQVVTLWKDGYPAERRVDRCNVFGNRAAGRIWCSFISLVIWIATYIKHIPDLFNYIDDAFSWEFAHRTMWYERYHRPYPEKQTRLLLLWDELGIPHAEKKQVFGSPLTIIGFDVDPNEMRITLARDKCVQLYDRLLAFVDTHSVRRRTLREFQQIAGWVNWALNVFPLLRPGLSILYDKIQNKVNPFLRLYISTSLAREILWIAKHILQSNGVFLLKSVMWSSSQASVVIYTDASPIGLAFWAENHHRGFQSSLPAHLPTSTIFFLEALAVVSAIEYVTACHLPSPSRLLIYCDNLNTVHLFNTLHAQPLYNSLLLYAVDLLIQYNIDLRVLHVPSCENVVADALSRWDNHRALLTQPSLSIYMFQPPRDALGASQK